MKRFLIVAAVATSMIACNGARLADNNLPRQNLPSIENNIPIAKVDANGDIQLLFLQKDVQDAFKEEFPDLELVFVEIEDDDNTNEEAGLLYQIYDMFNGVKETSLSLSVTLEGGYYYIQQNMMATTTWCTCTTNDPECARKAGACEPRKENGGWACSLCPTSDQKCTKQVGSGSGSGKVTALAHAINNAVALYGSM